MNEVENQGARTGFPRRTLMRGVAWTAPVVAVAAVAPAFAASPVPPGGLDGLVQLQRTCSGNTMLTIDGTGTYPNRGLWVFQDPKGQGQPTAADIIFYFEKSNLTFANSSEAGWSPLTLDATAPSIAGFSGYRTRYTGAWTYISTPTGQARWQANTKPKFSTTYATGTCSIIRAYARRTVTVDGTTVTFRRGPVRVG